MESFNELLCGMQQLRRTKVGGIAPSQAELGARAPAAPSLFPRLCTLDNASLIFVLKLMQIYVKK